MHWASFIACYLENTQKICSTTTHPHLVQKVRAMDNLQDLRTLHFGLLEKYLIRRNVKLSDSLGTGVCVLSLQSCLTLCKPMDCSPPGSSVCVILQARMPEWVPMPASRGSSWPKDRIRISSLLLWQVDSLSLVPPGRPIAQGWVECCNCAQPCVIGVKCNKVNCVKANQTRVIIQCNQLSKNLLFWILVACKEKNIESRKMVLMNLFARQ